MWLRVFCLAFDLNHLHGGNYGKAHFCTLVWVFEKCLVPRLALPFHSVRASGEFREPSYLKILCRSLVLQSIRTRCAARPQPSFVSARPHPRQQQHRRRRRRRRPDSRSPSLRFVRSHRFAPKLFFSDRPKPKQISIELCSVSSSDGSRRWAMFATELFFPASRDILGFEAVLSLLRPLLTIRKQGHVTTEANCFGPKTTNWSSVLQGAAFIWKLTSLFRNLSTLFGTGTVFLKPVISI